MARSRPVACFVSTTLLFLSLAASSASQETGDLDRLRQRALELVNDARRDSGLEPLSQGDTLNEAAQTHAEDMLRRDYYAHVSPEGNTVMDRYVEAGGSRWRLTAENIARCRGCASPPTGDRVENLHEGWMNSPPHRENILRAGLDRFGFGIVVGADQTLYAVQTFAGAGRPRDIQPDDEVARIEPERQTQIALQRINTERRANDLEPLQAASALIQGASNLVPQDDLSRSAATLQGDLADAMPSDAGRDWRSFAAFAGRCGGCGEEPSAADVRFFVQQWLDEAGFRSRLLSPEVTHLGLVVRADGEGLKVAAAVLGQHR
jgi:uncharacterized protein YkwD